MESSATFRLVWFLFLLAKVSFCREDCGPRRLDLVVEGRTCQPPCIDFCGGFQSCLCDDDCGMSCVDTTRRCTDEVPKPENGIVLISRDVQRFRSRVRFQCFNGYRLSRMDGRSCRSDGKWSGVTPSCLPELCPIPPIPRNGYIVPARRDEWPFGSKVTYFCDRGYVLSPLPRGRAMRFCSPGGQWTGSVPRCVRSGSDSQEGRCESPPGILNGWFRLDDNDSSSSQQVQLVSSDVVWRADDVIIYRCKPGFDLVSGDLRRVCKWNGDWTGKQPRCVRSVNKPKDVYCDSPPHVENGWVENDRNIGDVEQLRPPINQQNDNFAPTLVEIRWRPDDVILYRCKSRFELAGGSKRRTCTSEGAWTGTQPRCILKEASSCAAPSNPTGGFVLPQGKLVWKTGEAYSVFCNSDYAPPSPNLSTCLQDGTWSPGELRCVRTKESCPSPPRIPNSRYSRLSGGFPVGQRWPVGAVVAYDCRSGYKKRGDGIKTCLGGTWSGKTISCEAPVICGRPVVRQGIFVPQEVSTWRPGDVFSIRCSAGYREPSPNLSTCGSDGSWSPSELRCAKAYCSRPAISNGWVVPDRSNHGQAGRLTIIPAWSPGDVAVYSCSNGFRLVGDERRRCLEDGTWTGSRPTCEAKPSGYCPSPSKIENGFIENNRNAGHNSQSSFGHSSPHNVLGSVVTRWGIGDAIQYRCKNGFQLQGGSRSRVCAEGGVWTGTAPRCETNPTEYCQSPPPIPNGFVENDRNVGQNSQASPGQSNAQFAVVGAIVRRWINDDVIRYRCKDGFRLEGGSERRVCTDGVWSGTPPRCTAKSIGYCPSPPRIDNGFIENDRNAGSLGALSDMAGFSRPVATRWVKGSAIRYSCKSGYRLDGGSERRVCTGEGMWTGRHPQCIRVAPPSGDAQWMRLSNGLSYAATTHPASFSEAIAKCLNMGGKIASRSITAGPILRELLGISGIAIFGRSYWIGLTDRELEQDWKWLDGTRMSPDEIWHRFDRHDILFGHQKDCAAIVANPTARWRAENCGGEHLAMCERGGDSSYDVEHRSAVDGDGMTSPGSDSEAFVVVPIEIQINESAGGASSGEIMSCDPNPCLNGCECEESGPFGYFCHSMGQSQYLGNNCEYDPPGIECEHDAIEISLSSEFIQGMDGGMGNGVAYLAPDEESAGGLEAISKGCRFVRSGAGDVYRVIIPFPFDSCGTYEASGDGGISFGNKIWYNRELTAELDISVHSSVAEITCSYEDFYRVTSVIDSVCCPTPPIVTSNGVFMFETTVWADPPKIPGSNVPLAGENRTRADLTENGYISYRVGEMLYLTVKMKSRHGTSDFLVPALRRCWLSPNIGSHDPRADRDLVLLPRSDSNVNTYGPVSTGAEVHFGFQLVRAKHSAIVFLHCQIKVVSKRVRRSLKSEDEDQSSILTKGPIVFVNPPRRLPIPDDTNHRMDSEDSRNRLILGISFFGVAAIALVFGCCVAHLRSISARQRPRHFQGTDYHRQQDLSFGGRSSVNAVHPIT